MDPLSITAASFSIAGAIAKASVAIFDFCRDAKDATDDLSRVNAELRALSEVLDPLTRNLSTSSVVSDRLAQQLQGSLEGCLLVVSQIADLIVKYHREGAWTKTKWVMVGRDDVEKLRGSLEAYKMALSLGLHAISVAIQENIKRDTDAIRDENRVLLKYAKATNNNTNQIPAIKDNVDEILGWINSIRQGHRSSDATWVEQWMEGIEILTSYAQTTYQETIVDWDEERGKSPTGEGSEEGPDVDDDSGPAALEEPSEPGNSRLHGDSTLSGQRTTGRLPDTQVGSSTHRGKSVKRQTPSRNVDLVVGIDIGEGSVAVAYMGFDSTSRVIIDWPGGTGPRVPTSIAYDSKDGVSWGFECAENGESLKHLSLIELMRLGDETHDLVEHRATRAAWIDFLRHLHDHIRDFVSSDSGISRKTWADMTIEFHFTLPDRVLVARPLSYERAVGKLKDVLRAAGIGTQGRNCAALSLSETEAIARSVFGNQTYGDDCTLLVKVGEVDISLVSPSTDMISKALMAFVDVTSAAGSNEVFAGYIQPLLQRHPTKYSTVAVIATGATADRCADELRRAVKSEKPSLSVVPSALPDSGPLGAAAEGLLIHRNAWARSRRNPIVSMNHDTPNLFIRVRDDTGVLKPTRGKYYSKLYPGIHTDDVAIDLTAVRGRSGVTPLSFDVFFTSCPLPGSRIPGATLADDKDHRYMKLCTIRSSVSAPSLQRGYSKSQSTHIVRSSLRLFAMEPFKAGPQFQFLVQDDESGKYVPQETEVTWDAEPPYMVWPPQTVVGQRYDKELASDSESNID